MNTDPSITHFGIRAIDLRSLLILSTSLSLWLGFTAYAQDSTRYALEAGLVFSTFQQQVKAKVGDPRGERLVNQTEVGLLVTGMYRFWEYAEGGLFLQYDRGNRHAATFAGFDSQTGRTITVGSLGGDYAEFWAGPLVRFVWRGLFLEGGYGVVGLRDDDGRADIVNIDGDSTSSFSVNPSIAWLGGIGGIVPLTKNLDVVFRLSYRLRYYNERGGVPLPGTLEHGTQSITPFIGARYSW